MADKKTDWKEALKSEDAFKDFITNYFRDHKQLTGSYDIPSYYEHYTVTLDSHDGIVITLVTGMNQTGGSGNVSAPLPFKQKETMSIEDFRNLILHKKFADQDMSLADVFQTVAGVPDANDDND
ncbi:hypothetical protein [Lentilactobacillus parakefiri]|uniref:Uncharacterized protein n=1 Tax=Lentilactobacillus parakefiri TaxID=152332 RepID=A0A269YQ78_9LACO|nr:hypothetical protein [Lentilactobacillus parakefiri]KRL71304.1 hypothetical protein FD08_GL000609 [Lentilactobacillus parakefiri DSM 10551]PAK87559.1 hypothetical protein B8W98_00545 [Lentilactobacillus parakefiri]TDG90132.1 hypothetical protein C5L28_000185 [Lentilactobacillus parakefiri]GAW71570.1 hypothetical protein LPKJCM_00651 [Lentilactobacillus parakefiri]